jgi:hypothetical protein
VVPRQIVEDDVSDPPNVALAPDREAAHSGANVWTDTRSSPIALISLGTAVTVRSSWRSRSAMTAEDGSAECVWPDARVLVC